MKKQKLLDSVLALPAKQRELLATEIYQSLDAAKDDLNAAWIVEANRRMLQVEDTPPAVPEDKDFTNGDKDTVELESKEDAAYEMIDDVWKHIDQLRLHLTLDVRLRKSEKEEWIPGEQVMRELKERMAPASSFWVGWSKPLDRPPMLLLFAAWMILSFT